MTRKFGTLGSVAAATVALAAFTGTALAGNGNGGGAPGNSGSAPGQVKKDATAAAPAPVAAQPTAQAQAPSAPAHGNSASAPGHASKPAKGGGSAGQNSTGQPGMKPTNATAHNTHTTVGANPNVSKRYGNGQTAAGIAKSRGAPDKTELYGPGNSQPHKVHVCGKANGHWVDVHAVKSYTNAACTAQTQQPAAQVTQTGQCGSVTTTTASVRLQRGHAYGLLKQGKSLHSKTTTVSVTLPTGEVCTITASTPEVAQQQATQVLTQSLGTAPTQAQVAAAIKTQSSTPKSGVLGASVVEKAPAAKAGRGGVLGAVASFGHRAVRGSLPFTGFPIWAAVLIGAALILVGLALARRRGIRDTV